MNMEQGETKFALFYRFSDKNYAFVVQRNSLQGIRKACNLLKLACKLSKIFSPMKSFADTSQKSIVKLFNKQVVKFGSRFARNGLGIS